MLKQVNFITKKAFFIWPRMWGKISN